LSRARFGIGKNDDQPPREEDILDRVVRLPDHLVFAQERNVAEGHVEQYNAQALGEMVNGRPKELSRALCAAWITGSTPPLVPTPNWKGKRKSGRKVCRRRALVQSR
jgi:hypothetical protein